MEPSRLSLSRQYVSGNDVSGKDVSGKDASGKDVSGKDASGKDLSGKDVSGKVCRTVCWYSVLRVRAVCSYPTLWSVSSDSTFLMCF